MANTPKPINYEGQHYPTMRDFARAKGVTISCVSKNLYKGSLDRVRALGPDETILSRAHKAIMQPVASLGYEWESQAACAKDLGVTEGYLSRVLSMGRLDRLVTRRKGPKQWDTQKNSCNKCLSVTR